MRLKMTCRFFSESIRPILLASPAAPPACPKATSHLPCLDSRSIIPASLQKVLIDINFCISKPTPTQWCPHVSPHVNFKYWDAMNVLDFYVTQEMWHMQSVHRTAPFSEASNQFGNFIQGKVHRMK